MSYLKPSVGYAMQTIVQLQLLKIVGHVPILMLNRWLHICQAIDFKTSKITTVANGFVAEDIPANTSSYSSPYNRYHNESMPLGRIETLKDNLIIGLRGEPVGWTGK